MPNEQDTTVVEEPKVETEVAQVNGADGTTTEVSDANAGEPKVDPAELDRLRKEAAEAIKDRDQAKMRANQLENERKEQEKAERTKLQEGGEWETLAQKLLREKEERELSDAKRRDQELADNAERERQATVTTMRDEVFKDFPENVQTLAKKLDIWWDATDSVPAAQESLRAKLSDLQASLPGEPAVNHHANNPLAEPDPEFRELSLEEMRKILPKADSR